MNKIFCFFLVTTYSLTFSSASKRFSEASKRFSDVLSEPRYRTDPQKSLNTTKNPEAVLKQFDLKALNDKIEFYNEMRRKRTAPLNSTEESA